MNSQDTNIHKTSAELQQEVHGQIDKIGANIEGVRSRMTPGSLIDDAIFYPHGKSLTATYSHLKDNPMGTMFLSLGTLLLMEDQNRVTYEEHLKSSMSEAAEKGSLKYNEIKRNVGEKAHELSDELRSKKNELQREFNQKKDNFKARAHSKKDELERKYHDVKDSIAQEKEQIKEDFIAGARDLEGSARDLERDAELKSWQYKEEAHAKSQSIKEKGAQKIDDIRENISGAYSSAKESVEHQLDRVTPIGQALHPYAIASIGLGLGATLGASIPSNRVNNLIQGSRSQEELRRLNKDFDEAIRASGERLKGRLIDELKNISFN